MRMVKDLPVEERPREKGLRYGVEALSNRELLALLIRCGVKGQSALETADALLLHAGGLKGIFRMTPAETASVRGLSKIKALELGACMELVKRILYEQALEKDVMSSPEVIISWLRLEIGSLNQERFIVLYLDHANHLLRAETVFSGTVDMCYVSPREIFERAIGTACTSVLLVHNHPSGILLPSEEDRILTERLKAAGTLLGFRVMDHLIVTENGYFSFMKEGLMD